MIMSMQRFIQEKQNAIKNKLKKNEKAREFLRQVGGKKAELAEREVAIETNEVKKLKLFNKNQVIQEKLYELENL